MRALLLSALIATSLATPAMAQTRIFPDDAKLLELIKSRVDDGRATGLVLGVMEADGSTRIVSYGIPGAGALPLGPDTVFEIGSVTKIFTTTLLADMVQKGEVSPNARIGMGWITVTTKNGEFIYHDGGTGGYGAIVGIDPKRGVGVVLLGNRTGVPEDIAMHLFDPSIPLTPKPKPTSERVEIVVSPETLATYAGVYTLDAMPDFKLTVTVESGQLKVHATGQQTFPVFAESATKLFYKVVDAQLTFVPAADGNPAHLILHQGGMNQKATKQP